MVRIVGKENKEVPAQAQNLNPASEALLQIVGIMIADKPQAVCNLLEDYSIELPENISEAELTEILLDALKENNPEFNSDLASLILDCSLESEYDNFDFKSLFKKGASSEGEQEAESGSNTGGLISGVAGALGKIGDGIKNKLNRDQATSQTLQGIYAYKTQALATEQSKAKSKRNMLIAVLFLLGLSFLGFMYFMNKPSTQTPPLKT